MDYIPAEELKDAFAGPREPQINQVFTLASQSQTTRKSISILIEHAILASQLERVQSSKSCTITSEVSPVNGEGRVDWIISKRCGVDVGKVILLNL